jgi:peptidylprolyl isomerase
MAKTAVLIAVSALLATFFWISSTDSKITAENIAKGRAFLTANSQKEGVITTASGLQYLLIKKGDGTSHPSLTDSVKAHYQGRLIDGTLFDSSIERGEPLSFRLNQVISGWAEGLQLMVAGEKARLFIPSQLGYGEESTHTIPPGSTLIFDVELLEIAKH